MSKFFSFLIIGLLALGTIAAVRQNSVPTGLQADFIPVSVLADNQADYGIDENLYMIPSISLEIIADKLQDEGQTKSSLPVIFFTSGIQSNDDKDSNDTNEDIPADRVKDKRENNNNGNGTGVGIGNGIGQGNTNSQDKAGNSKANEQNGKPDLNRDKGNTDKGKGRP